MILTGDCFIIFFFYTESRACSIFFSSSFQNDHLLQWRYLNLIHLTEARKSSDLSQQANLGHFKALQTRTTGKNFCIFPYAEVLPARNVCSSSKLLNLEVLLQGYNAAVLICTPKAIYLKPLQWVCWMSFQG